MGVGGGDGELGADPQDRDGRAGRPGLKITGGANVSVAPAQARAKKDIPRPVEDDGVGDAVAVEIGQKRCIA